MQADSSLSDCLARVETLTNRVNVLTDQLAAVMRSSSGRLSVADRAALTKALAVYEREAPGLGARVFNARELLSVEGVREALRPVIQDGTDASAPRRVGKLLARGAGQVLGDVHLCRAGEERTGAIWRIATVRS